MTENDRALMTGFWFFNNDLLPAVCFLIYCLLEIYNCIFK